MPTNISYPMRVINGRLQVSTGATAIADQINNVIDTRFGERVMRPTFGIKDYVFEVTSQVTAVSDIERNIQFWVPRPPINLSILDSEIDKSLLINVEFEYNNETTQASIIAL